MELLDIFDSLGRKTTQVATREEAHIQGLWHQSVHIWILNDQNQILTQQRSADRPTNPNKWGISAAGHIASGELPLSVAQRECYEELGLDIPLSKFKHIGRILHTYDEGQTQNREFQHIYLVRDIQSNSSIQIQKSEVQDFKWIELNEFFEQIQDEEKWVTHPEEYRIMHQTLYNDWPIEKTRPGVECFEIYNQHKENLNFICSRNYAHQHSLWHQTIHLWLVNPQNQLLIQQRHANKQTDPLKWDISVAGHIDAFQSPYQALLKESQEEIQFEIENQNIYWLGVFPNISKQTNTSALDCEFQHFYLCQAQVNLEKLQFQSSEIAQIKWISIKEYISLLEQNHPDYIQHPLEIKALKQYLNQFLT